jgi:hypothetical protein
LFYLKIDFRVNVVEIIDWSVRQCRARIIISNTTRIS